MTASYTKLKSGDWGVRVQGKVAEGDVVTVTKKSGETKRETISKVVWSGNGVSICAIEQSASPRGYRRSGRGGSGRCRECGGPIRNAPHHRAMGGYCGYCAFDEFDC